MGESYFGTDFNKTILKKNIFETGKFEYGLGIKWY